MRSPSVPPGASSISSRASAMSCRRSNRISSRGSDGRRRMRSARVSGRAGQASPAAAPAPPRSSRMACAPERRSGRPTTRTGCSRTPKYRCAYPRAVPVLAPDSCKPQVPRIRPAVFARLCDDHHSSFGVVFPRLGQAEVEERHVSGRGEFSRWRASDPDGRCHGREP